MGDVALLFDGENVSANIAAYCVQIAQTHASSLIGSVYGNRTTYLEWQRVCQYYNFAYRLHNGGKNAADSLLIQDAWTLYKGGIRLFYIVSNDGDFAPSISILRYYHCQVIGIGYHNASKKLMRACNDYLVYRQQQSVLHMAGSHPTISKQKGPDMASYNVDQSVNPVTPPVSQQEARNVLYGHSFPHYFFLLLQFLLEHIFQTLQQIQEYPTTIPPGVHTPSEYVELLVSLRKDPIFAELFTAEHSVQWERIRAFAERCDAAYQQGYTDANSDSAFGLLNTQSEIFREQVQYALRSNFSFHRPSEQEITPFVREQEYKVQQYWYSCGYVKKAREIEAQQQQEWDPANTIHKRWK